MKNNSVNFSQDPAHSSMMCCRWRVAFLNLQIILNKSSARKYVQHHHHFHANLFSVQWIYSFNIWIESVSVFIVCV